MKSRFCFPKNQTGKFYGGNVNYENRGTALSGASFLFVTRKPDEEQSGFPLSVWLSAAASLAIFFALGCAGWLTFEKLRAPAPAILGALFFLGAARFFGFEFAVPRLLQPCLSVAVGIMLGLRFNINGKGLFRIIALAAFWLAALTFIASRVLMLLGLDRPTAFFASTPGGLSEIILMSLSFGTDTFAVVLLQLSRMLFTLFAIPFTARLVSKRQAAGQADVKEETVSGGTAPENSGGTIRRSLVPVDWLAFAVLGAGAAWLFNIIRCPAPNLMGPMLGIGVYTKLRRIKIKINPTVQKFVQVGVGGIVGLSMSRESILSFPSYILPVASLNIILIGGCFLLAFVMRKFSGWDIKTCLIAAAPGGMSPMILLAMEMGADSQKVAVFQILRMLLVLILTPLAVNLLLH